MNRFVLIVIGAIITVSASACEKAEVAGILDLTETKTETGMEQTNDKRDIETFITARNKAMCDQDTLALSRMMADDLVLVHLSGAKQSKVSWLKDIADGTMRYYKIDVPEMEITVNGDSAVAKTTSVIEARIWGSNGTWTLRGTMYLRRTADGWIWTN